VQKRLSDGAGLHFLLQIDTVFGGEGVGVSGVVELSDLDGTNGFVLNDNGVGNVAGTSVSDADDLNGDGVDDLIIGAFSSVPGPAGSYVVFRGGGMGVGGSVELSELDGSDDFAIDGLGSQGSIDIFHFLC